MVCIPVAPPITRRGDVHALLSTLPPPSYMQGYTTPPAQVHAGIQTNNCENIASPPLRLLAVKKQNKIITNDIKLFDKIKLHYFTHTLTKSVTRLISSRARDPRLLHGTLGWTADRAPDIYTVQLWNYNKLICPEAALLS